MKILLTEQFGEAYQSHHWEVKPGDVIDVFDLQFNEQLKRKACVVYLKYRPNDQVYPVSLMHDEFKIYYLPKFWDYVKGIPAIGAAILARTVRKISKKKGTKLERKLMNFYYEQEKKHLFK